MDTDAILKAGFEQWLAADEKVGGRAFPTTFETPDGGAFSSYGMSLHDWFAGQALIGLLANHAPVTNRYGEHMQRTADVMADGAYELADAMLAKRAK